jgi:hypothetical protein
MPTPLEIQMLRPGVFLSFSNKLARSVAGMMFTVQPAVHVFFGTGFLHDENEIRLDCRGEATWTIFSKNSINHCLITVFSANDSIEY